MQRIIKSIYSPSRCFGMCPRPQMFTLPTLLQKITISTNEAGNREREKSVKGRSQRRGGVNSGGGGGLVKDRYPPVTTDLSDPRRRLALLVDASGVEPRVFRNTILPAALKVGTPVLVRIFAVQLSNEWESLVAGSGSARRAPEADATDDSPGADTGSRNSGEAGGDVGGMTRTWCPPVEFFRVERFIPVPMQMEADANHIFDFRQQNKIEAVCFICNEVDRGVFEGFLSNIAGHGFNQYVLDELGMAKEVLEDGRSADGSPTL
uniref:Uncharacterized protein n=1 Tax=Trypanosoma congolense (strain IL3000) TaxID=1068625 RepID=G0UK30_TRYCI|nr:conserved hypothetical protein [Trypanosoma congolense IL3000]